MDHFSEPPNKSGRFLNPTKRPKPDRRWTLLFIGNRGKTITLKRFKGMVLLTLLILCVSIAISVGLLFLSLNIRQEKVQLESRMDDLKAQIKALRYEKDVLMTRLVLAESRSKESPVKIQAKQDEPKPAALAESDSAKPEQPIEQTAIQAEVPAAEQNETEETADQTDTELSVVLEDFQVIPKPEENLLRFHFKIKNTSSNSQRVSGYTVVVLKGDQLAQDKWIAVPAIPLVDGKPSGRQRGHSFGINYFKTMRFSSNYPKFAEQYQVATVYVFTRKGDLLLEDDFPITLPAAFRSVQTAPRPSDETTGPEPPATSSGETPAADELVNTPQTTATPSNDGESMPALPPGGAKRSD